MAEFQEVAKTYDRLCGSYDECYKCPMFRPGDKNDPIVCRYWTLIVDPKIAEKVILHWGKKHPIKTNGMKFKEIFGDHVVWETDEDMEAWFNAEYKGEQNERSD